MDRLKEWSDTIIKEPAKPDGDIDAILASSYDTIAKLPIGVIEKAIFILDSYIFYVTYRYGMTEAYIRYHEAKNDTAGLVKERIKASHLKELKFALQSKMSTFKMIYYRMRDEKKDE